MHKSKIFFLLILLLGNLSCRKAIKKNPAYQGVWRGSEQCDPEIKVKGDGSGYFGNNKTLSDCQHGSRRGKVRITITGNTFMVGLKQFKIDQEPTIIDTVDISYPNEVATVKSNIKMILDGVSYYKVIE